MRIQEASVGQVIRFGRRNGQQTLGAIVAVGIGRRRDKVKVKTMEPRGVRRLRPAGGIWTVPVSMCTLAEPDAVVVVANEPETVTPVVDMTTVGLDANGNHAPSSNGNRFYSRVRDWHRDWPWFRALSFVSDIASLWPAGEPSAGHGQSAWVAPIRSGAITGAEAAGMAEAGLGTIERLSPNRRLFYVNRAGVRYLADARQALRAGA